MTVRRLVHTREPGVFRSVEATDRKDSIYAGTDRSGFVCVLKRDYDNEVWTVIPFDGSFTRGDGYGPYTTIHEAIEEFAENGAAYNGEFYEFTTTMEFLEWAVEREKERISKL